METIEINGHKWLKGKGDEGQDVYVAQFKIKDDDVIGKYADKGSYDILVDSDADFYLPTDNVWHRKSGDVVMDENNIAFKFRKNVFTPEEQRGAYEGLYDAAGESNNRGMAAGPRAEQNLKRDWVTPYQNDVLLHFINRQPGTADGSNPLENIRKKHETKKHETRGIVWLRSKVESEFGEYTNFFPKAIEKMLGMDILEASNYAKTLKEKFISGTTYATPLWSGIAGFYGRYPRIPYGRPTAYTEQNLSKFEKSYPFARKLEAEFKRMLPMRWAKQKAFADRLDNKFLIGEDTTFTTITVNTMTKDRNARMACHKDAGSLVPGFSNLTVVTKDGKGWKGGYLVTPEVRAAINVRPGDLLLIDNMRIIHGNTPIEAPDSGEDDFLRMSLVYYFREDMDGLGSWDYEKTRRQFVDDRRTNKDHPDWKQHWNGVSPSMWGSEEWYKYLEEKLGQEVLSEYHPEAVKQTSSLEGFF